MNESINPAYVRAGQNYCEKLFGRDKKISLALDAGGCLSSINPPESLFGYIYHSHMVPPFKPESIAILGYGRGTVAELIRKVWGDVKITGVDIALKPGYVENKLISADAEEFVQECTNSLIKTRFDYVAVDLWDGFKVPEFVYDEKFAYRLYRMTKELLCINQPYGAFEKLEPYDKVGFKFHRSVRIFGNIVSWWGV